MVDTAFSRAVSSPAEGRILGLALGQSGSREQERPDCQSFCFSIAPACETVPLGGGPWVRARADRLFLVRCRGWRAGPWLVSVSANWTCCPFPMSEALATVRGEGLFIWGGRLRRKVAQEVTQVPSPVCILGAVRYPWEGRE